MRRPSQHSQRRAGEREQKETPGQQLCRKVGSAVSMRPHQQVLRMFREITCEDRLFSPGAMCFSSSSTDVATKTRAVGFVFQYIFPLI